jgi:hypothetical protein
MAVPRARRQAPSGSTRSKTKSNTNLKSKSEPKPDPQAESRPEDQAHDALPHTAPGEETGKKRRLLHSSHPAKRGVISKGRPPHTRHQFRGGKSGAH